MTRIVILTGSELRHTFFRKFMALSPDIEVAQSYCEGLEKSLRAWTERETVHDLRARHLAARERSERDFFGLFVQTTPDCSNPLFLPKGDINLPQYTDGIMDQDPDLVVLYGCSIIREPLLSHFRGRMLNVHLGLSPYYRGSGTNYWPLVNREPEYVGATFMYPDAGIDTGKILHQMRASIVWGDTPVQIGNRLIVDMARTYREIVLHFKEVKEMPRLPKPFLERYYRKSDFSEESVAKLYQNFKEGLVEAYLREASARCSKVPMIENPGIPANPCE